MNQTDVRIAFKMDTGEDALWAKTHDGKDLRGTSIQKGYPRSFYGRWIEQKIGEGSQKFFSFPGFNPEKTKYLRDRYFQVKREEPTSNYYNPGGREVFYGDYIEWLETFYIKLILRDNDSL